MFLRIQDEVYFRSKFCFYGSRPLQCEVPGVLSARHGANSSWIATCDRRLTAAATVASCPSHYNTTPSSSRHVFSSGHPLFWQLSIWSPFLGNLPSSHLTPHDLDGTAPVVLPLSVGIGPSLKELIYSILLTTEIGSEKSALLKLFPGRLNPQISTRKGEKPHLFSIRVIGRIRWKPIPAEGHLVTKVRNF